MKTKWSKHWKSSKQRRKQRKYITNAPLHIRKKLFSTNLSKNLRKKYNFRNVPLIKGDQVKVMRGQFKKHIGKVESKDYKKIKIYIEGINAVKKDGTKKFIPIHPSNVMITELNLDDKKRKNIFERKRK
jgi:large subunit ribosomal protein L24